MFVRMHKNLGAIDGLYRAGRIYRVLDIIARDWIRRGLCEQTETPPEFVAQLMSRLDEGAGRRVLFLPFVGEFGHEICTHVRIVHFNRAAEKIVCCRPGNEVLYPSAAGFVSEWPDPLPDRERGGTQKSTPAMWPELLDRFPGYQILSSGGLTPEQEIIAIRPTERIPFKPHRRGLRADVLLGVRRREYGPSRNWQHWPAVASALRAAGISFAVIGHRSTSFDLPGQVCHSGDFGTDAAIELLQHCRLYVGNDSGNSHLAATVGAPMLLVRETASQTRDFTARMEEVNPGRVELVQDGWDRPQLLIRRMLDRLEARA